MSIVSLVVVDVAINLAEYVWGAVCKRNGQRMLRSDFISYALTLHVKSKEQKEKLHDGSLRSQYVRRNRTMHKQKNSLRT